MFHSDLVYLTQNVKALKAVQSERVFPGWMAQEVRLQRPGIGSQVPNPQVALGKTS